MAFVNDARRWARNQMAPVTVGLSAGLLAAFLAAWATRGGLMPFLALVPKSFLPWTLATYPFASTGDGRELIWLLLLVLWFFSVGSQLERELGGRKFGGLALGMTILAGLCVGFGALAAGVPIVLAGAMLPVAGLTVAWGVRNPGAECRIYGILPLTGRVIAILTVVLTFFGYGSMHYALGPLSVVHLAAAYLVATDRVPWFLYRRPPEQSKAAKVQDRQGDEYFEEVRKREKERQEVERLRRLFDDTDGR